jgi:hypothetical protein
MNTLPPDFQFTQGSLQDYVDCRRRFQLRYLERIAWPAVEAEPIHESERRSQLGIAFHRLAQQYLLGVPAARITEMLAGSRAAGTELQRWWENYLRFSGPLVGSEIAETRPQRLLVEAVFSAPLGGYRLVAKYDVVLWRPEDFGSSSRARVTIVDWKTSKIRPERGWLAARVQTKVYPFTLACVGTTFENATTINQAGPLAPDQIEMVYWFPESPHEPERFTYSQEQFAQDREYLQGLVAEIERLGAGDFHLTPHEERCAFCTYRSLCDRGVRAGSLEQIALESEVADDLEFRLELDQITEIEF